MKQKNGKTAKQSISALLAGVFAFLVLSLPLSADAASKPVLLNIDLHREKAIQSSGSGSNWAGVSNVSQFVDENGNFCFVYEENGSIVILKTKLGLVTAKLSVAKLYPQLGAATCDAAGNIYLVWGRPNSDSDTSVKTIFVTKHNTNGTLLTTVSGNGSECASRGMDASYNTKKPFSAGNCDVAINGNILLVNYAREMYSGHQSNGNFAVNLDTMTVLTSFSFYNSHSFDQRVTPYGDSGFLMASQGDCYARGFVTAVTDFTSVQKQFHNFNFWVEQNALSNFNMMQLNRTYARLGNIVETSKGVAFIGCSARALSQSAKDQPYDLFVQVFDPTASPSSPDSYVTTGTRTGLAGNNGTSQVTDYGVLWLSNLAGTGKSVSTVQAVATDEDTVVVLYELTKDYYFDSSWYMVLGADGRVKKQPVSMGKVMLNRDEDPVFAQGAIQWVSNKQEYDTGVVLHSLLIKDAEDDASVSLYREWMANNFSDVPENSYYTKAVKWACTEGITSGTGDGLFSPDAVCTRAQMVTFLWRAAGSPAPTAEGDAFTDVDKQSFYYDAIQWACENEITSGTGGGRFSPEMSCSRGQMAVFLYRFSGSPTVEGEQTFPDVQESDYFNTAVIWASNEKVTSGIGNGLYGPNIACTRGQMVTFLYNLLASN